jgi:hypothetical protein
MSSTQSKKRYFRYLSVDPADSNYIYAGAVDHAYRLEAADISKGSIKSVNLSEVNADVIGAIRDNLANCVSRGKDPGFSCQNHVRAVIRMNNRLFVCATGVDSPIVYYLQADSLDVSSVELRGGRAKCPYDPNSTYTIVYVESGNPGGVPATYSGTVTDFSNADSVIFRPTLVDDSRRSNEYRLLRTEQDSRWLNDPKFVGSFDVDDYVYFFFREHALEHAGCGKLVYSRVARVCKNDEGGSSLSMDFRWTTYLKARLNCSQPGDSPFYFNEIYDVQYNSTERSFTGLFRTIHNGFWGSAVCSFSVDAINRVFDHGPFKGQQNFETAWFSVSEREVPVPRPGQCRHSSLELSTSALAFIKSHPLMHDSVDTIDGRPLYVTKDDSAFTRLAVDHVGRYAVFFIGSSRGTIHKVVQWRDGSGRVQFLTVAILKPFRNDVVPIWQMILQTAQPAKTTFLYLATDDAIVQLPVEECYRYTLCLTCVRDPYCGWDGALQTCLPYRHGAGLIQRVSLTSSDDVCNQICLHASNKQHHSITKTEVLQGVPLHITCMAVPPGCLQPADARITWYFADASLGSTITPPTSPPSPPRLVRPDGIEFIMTRDNGLVIMDVNRKHAGIYSCVVGGYTMSRHDVRVLPCRFEPDKEQTWKQELKTWCNAFTAYEQEYNHWMCLKSQCIEEKCIPQSIIDKCRP